MTGMLLSPDEAYRRIDLDARIEGSDSEGLAKICLEAVVGSFDSAIIAHGRGRDPARNAALARAHAIILGMDRSLDADNPVAGAMREFYGAALVMIGRAMRAFEADAIASLRDDFDEVLSALIASRQPMAAPS